jgi:hypothetical protein
VEGRSRRVKRLASVPSMGKIELAGRCQPEGVTTTVAKRNAQP